MKQDGRTMAYMLNDQTQYIMMPKIRYAPGIGTHVSYDIAVYDCFERDVVKIFGDVTPDRELALRMVGMFNRHQLSPIHLDEAIHDMLN